VLVTATCFRCGQPAFATLRIEALADNHRLKLARDASDSAICPTCVIELPEWVKEGRPSVALKGRLSSGVID